jgi:hypothetical protein
MVTFKGFSLIMSAKRRSSVLVRLPILLVCRGRPPFCNRSNSETRANEFDLGADVKQLRKIYKILLIFSLFKKSRLLIDRMTKQKLEKRIQQESVVKYCEYCVSIRLDLRKSKQRKPSPKGRHSGQKQKRLPSKYSYCYNNPLLSTYMPVSVEHLTPLVKIKVTLRPTISQSVRLGVEIHLGLMAGC